MSDGTNLNTMSGGDKIDTEDFGSRGKAQRFKLVVGVLDTDSGDVSDINPFPTKLMEYVSGEDSLLQLMQVEHRYSKYTINTAGTFVVSPVDGFIHSFNIIGGTLGTITVYNNTAASGTDYILPPFTPTSTLPCNPIILDELFSVGMTVVTAAATVINISWR